MISEKIFIAFPFVAMFLVTGWVMFDVILSEYSARPKRQKFHDFWNPRNWSRFSRRIYLLYFPMAAPLRVCLKYLSMALYGWSMCLLRMAVGSGAESKNLLQYAKDLWK